jgi:hypothetical protein
VSVYDGGDILSPRQVMHGFSVATTNYWRAWDVRSLAAARVYMVPTEGTLSTASVILEHSANGVSWEGMDSAQTLDAQEDTAEMDLSSINYLRVRTNVAKSGCKVYLSLAAKPRALVKG